MADQATEPSALASAYDTVMRPIEGSLYMMGLANSDWAWLLRIGIGALATGIILYVLEPGWAWAHFDKDGKHYSFPKDWSFTAKPVTLKQHPEVFTPVPWWLAALSVGLVFGLFV